MILKVKAYRLICVFYVKDNTHIFLFSIAKSHKRCYNTYVQKNKRNSSGAVTPVVGYALAYSGIRKSGCKSPATAITVIEPRLLSRNAYRFATRKATLGQFGE